MGPPRHPAHEGGRPADRRRPAEKLDKKPDSQEKERRDLHHGEEEEQRHQRQDPRPGKKKEVRPEHARDRPGRPDIGNHRNRLEHDLDEKGEYSAQKIEQQIPPAAQHVFDVVPEDIEVEHVSEEVSPPAVKEHGGQGRQQLPRVPECRLQEAERDESISIDEVNMPVAQCQLVQEGGYVQGDQPVIDNRSPGGRDRIFQGYDRRAPGVPGYRSMLPGASQIEK